jgi:hypothetical protein
MNRKWFWTHKWLLKMCRHVWKLYNFYTYEKCYRLSLHSLQMHWIIIFYHLAFYTLFFKSDIQFHNYFDMSSHEVTKLTKFMKTFETFWESKYEIRKKEMNISFDEKESNSMFNETLVTSTVKLSAGNIPYILCIVNTWVTE